MEKIRINNFKEHLYYEKLENGLEVFLVPLKMKKSYTAMFLTKYGGRDIEFKINDKEVKTPTGIAHFLEHKLFENEDEDPFSFYEKFGTDVNASTSHDFTSYYIYGSKSYKKNLSYLVNWIQGLTLTDELVKKEQGIILEEASMYKDNPSRCLSEKIKENVFVNDPYRNKVIGTDDDIKSITKDEIELCYNSFYSPSNMIIISVGNFNPKEALEIIKENTKDFKNKAQKIEKVYRDEPDTVYKEYEKLEFNTENTRIAVAYKINKNDLKNLNITSFELDLYLNSLLNIGLGATSEIREKWLYEKLFTTSFYKIIETETHYVIEFDAMSENSDLLLEKLQEYLKDIKINKEDFERGKKAWIASEVKTSSNINSILYSILDDVLDYGCFIPNKIEIIKALNFEKLEEVKKKIIFKNKAVVKMVPKLNRNIVK
ncbi:MAG: pitrilysin family protein [bacterium]|nr:pitrilysin family protein [bacterium]